MAITMLQLFNKRKVIKLKKKKYLKAEMEITEFDTEDVITTSGGEETGGDEGGDDYHEDL